MLPFYILALLLHTAFSCEEGTEIISKEITDFHDIIGNWTIAYHWDHDEYDHEFIQAGIDVAELPCVNFIVTPATEEFIKEKKEECAGIDYPFDWKDLVVKIDIPMLTDKSGAIFFKDTGNYWFHECNKPERVIFKWVEDFLAIVSDSDTPSIDLVAKEIPKLEELKCVAHNADIGKGFNGFGMCYTLCKGISS